MQYSVNMKQDSFGGRKRNKNKRNLSNGKVL